MKTLIEKMKSLLERFFVELFNLKNWIKTVLSVMKSHFFSIFIIVLVYIMFWHLPQIKDLLAIIIQEEHHVWQMILFFASLSVLALLISNLAAILDNTTTKKGITVNPIGFIKAMSNISDDKKDRHLRNNKYTIAKDGYKETEREYIERMLPKVLGTLLIVITAFGVNNIYKELVSDGAHILFGKISINIGFWLVLLLLLISLSKKVSTCVIRLGNKIDKGGYLPFLFLLISLVTIGILGIKNKQGADDDIRNLFWATILLAISFFLVSVSYNKRIVKLKLSFGVFITLLLTAIVVLFYMMMFFYPKDVQIINPLSIVLINLIAYFSIISLLLIIGKRRGRSILTYLLIGLIILGVYTASKEDFTHYEVSNVKATHKVEDRITLKEYVRLWLDERKPSIVKDSLKKFPVIFVSAEGGGSRAGLWSFLVHSYLYENHPDYFDKYLFSLTGASGGGVGNAMFYTAAHQHKMHNKTLQLAHTKAEIEKGSAKLNYKASTIYNANYLSSSVAALLGRDLFISVTGFYQKKDDRGKLVENEWETNYNKVFNIDSTSFIGNDFLSIMPQLKDPTKVMPLLMMNTTHLQSGQRSIVSPVNFRDNKYMKGFRDFLHNYTKHNPKNNIIKISTSMLLNARFPFLSPVAKVKGVGQYGDAGYYDNIGGAVTRGLENAFIEVLNEPKYYNLKNKISIRHLVIANKEAKKNAPLNETQLVAPLKMILGATFSHPKELKNTNSEFLVESARTYIYTNKKEPKDSIKPILPLGRFLSVNAIKSLEERLKNKVEVTSILDKLVE